MVSAQNKGLDKAEGRVQLAFDLRLPQGTVPVYLSALGQHNVINALAAAAAASALEFSAAEIAEGLKAFQPVTGRLTYRRGKQAVSILDDTYNANPDSMRAALAVLSEYTQDKLFVMGDMLELGAHARAWHREIGVEAKKLGIGRLFAVGDLSVAAVEAFGAGAMWYASKEALITALQEYVNVQTVILIKGSRSMHMEDIVQALTC
jgi:UDP-N-acetylmuramoyl-tripeptide--D-alanyl-D-alanine ligase